MSYRNVSHALRVRNHRPFSGDAGLSNTARSVIRFARSDGLHPDIVEV
ncbi:MAG TPA: hypothetical protein VK745_32130 [Polyangiaceae bacterium]|nr:hypothetical protein [Polyangiaceae bacterium]